MSLQTYVNHLGLEVRDKVTGLQGIVTSVSFDICNCVQLLVTPKASGDGSRPDSMWLDVKRVEVNPTCNPVMTASFQTVTGPTDKPLKE